MPTPKTRIQLEQLLFLKERGYKIPDALVDLAQEAEWKRRGIVEVWNCPCDRPYETQIPIQGAICRNQHQMKRVYP